jgi:chaperonin GroEL
VQGVEYATGYNIVVDALSSPLRQIATNAGKDGAVIVNDVVSADDESGYDAANDAIVNMLETGIVDPVKVTRSGVQHAASAAAILLTTEVAIAEEPKDDKEAGGMPDMGGMGGMGGGMGF